MQYAPRQVTTGGRPRSFGRAQRSVGVLPLTQREIFRFWLPLAAAWLMMAVEGPFLAAVIARLADPRFNLAAHGVAFAFALLVEAPVIMIMSASTALADSATNLRRLRAFTYALIGVTSAAMLTVLLPPVYGFLTGRLMALPPDVARLTYVALWILLPWPGAIGYRRFYQGLLIRGGRTRYVAYGTVFRLAAMTATALVLYLGFAPPGAYVGAAALATGVTIEALVSRWMARGILKQIVGSDPASAGRPVLSLGDIWRFYYPLALTSVIGLTVQPLLTFFMGRAAAPVESLAVFPVVVAVSFIFRSMGLSYQEVAIALMGEAHRELRPLGRFAVSVGLASAAGIALVAVPPVARFWFGTVSGLGPELTRFAIPATALLIPIPFLSVVLSYQRAMLVVARATRPVTWATVIEVAGIALVFPIIGWWAGVVGVSAAAIAFLIGRLAGNLYLIGPCARLVRPAPQ